MKIGLKYCGNCNPSYDTIKLVKHIKKYSPFIVEYTHWNAGDCDLIIVLHGCRCCCAELPVIGTPVIEISDGMVNNWPVGKADMEKVIIEEIQKVCKNLN